MNSNKKKRPQAAQQLIDSLLDDKKSSQKSIESLPSIGGNDAIDLGTSLGDADDYSIIHHDSPDSPSQNGTVSGVAILQERENTLKVEFNPDEASDESLALDSQTYSGILDPVAQAQRTALLEMQESNGEESLELEKKRSKIDQPEVPFKESARESSKPPFKGAAPVVTQRAESLERFAASADSADQAPQSGTPDPADLDEKTMKLEVPPSGRSTKKASSSEKTDLGGDDAFNDLIKDEVSKVLPFDFEKASKGKSKGSDPEATFDRFGPTEIRGGGKAASRPASGMGPSAFGSAEAALKQSESLRIAQSRITELEKELERLRRENEKLATAGETLRRRTDELTSKAENIEIQARESERIFDEEKKVLRGQMQSKDRENSELRSRLEEMEGRLESNFKKIRVRERELEHRLEIVKMESATLVSTKDKMILDLKRQIDQLVHENDYAKQKTQELFSQYKGKQDTIRRVVRALRIALTILEGDDENVVPIKKAE